MSTTTRTHNGANRPAERPSNDAHAVPTPGTVAPHRTFTDELSLTSVDALDTGPNRFLVLGRGAVQRLEHRHPDLLVNHALAFGWLWTLVWTLALIPADVFNWTTALWVLISVIALLPVTISTILVLSQTPHSHLAREDSVLSHFFLKFVGYLFAFFVWMIAIVLGALLEIYLGGHGNDTLNTSMKMLHSVIPLVCVLLWIALLVRYAFFLSRLRGWRARPQHTRIPVHVLHLSPRTRRIVIGLAHPGLLLSAGFFLTVVVSALLADGQTG